VKIVLKLILPLALIGLAYYGFEKLAASKPEPRSRPQREIISEVDLITVTPSEHRPRVESFGTVQAHFESTLTPQISGLIVKVSPSFRVGTVVPMGTTLIWIDERSYKSLLIQQEANLAQAELTYAEEKIQAEQAIEDWKDSGRDLDKASDFVLRKPQITAALAMIESMKASVRKAQGDLNRTMIKAPFDAIVTTRTASVGNLANEQQPIGTVVATERVEVRLTLTPDQASRVDLSTQIKVVLTSPTKSGIKWQGTITRVEPTLGQSQTTTAIVEVTNPFAKDSPHLPIGLFVNATLTANPLPPSLKIPEAALVNDSFLWALNAKDKLVRIPAERLTAEDGDLVIQVQETQLQPPFRIVSRPLATFQPGQKVTPSSRP
jgi:RND family efflux transporter MFP subunit